jgi:hypothetical protein
MDEKSVSTEPSEKRFHVWKLQVKDSAADLICEYGNDHVPFLSL